MTWPFPLSVRGVCSGGNKDRRVWLSPSPGRSLWVSKDVQRLLAWWQIVNYGHQTLRQRVLRYLPQKAAQICAADVVEDAGAYSSSWPVHRSISMSWWRWDTVVSNNKWQMTKSTICPGSWHPSVNTFIFLWGPFRLFKDREGERERGFPSPGSARSPETQWAHPRLYIHMVSELPEWNPTPPPNQLWYLISFLRTRSAVGAKRWRCTRRGVLLPPCTCRVQIHVCVKGKHTTGSKWD